MTSPRTLAAEAMTPRLAAWIDAACQNVDELAPAAGADVAAGAWLYVGEIAGRLLYSLRINADGDVPGRAPSSDDDPTAVGDTEPGKCGPPGSPGPVSPTTSDAGEADPAPASPAPTTSTPGGTATPRAVPAGGSIEEHRAYVTWIAEQRLEEVRSANDLTAVLFEMRRRARDLLAHPAPVDEDRRQRFLIEDIYLQLVPRKAASYLKGQLRYFRVEHLAELGSAALEAVLERTARDARRQGWRR